MSLVTKVRPYLLTVFLVANIFLFLASLVGLFDPDIVTPPVISQPAPNVTTIRVPEFIITEKIVNKYFSESERKQLNDLLDENKKLKIEVEQLSFSLAQYQSAGGGTIIVGTLDTANPVALPKFTFKDWRLSFTGEGTTAAYTLNQQFAILNSVGYDRNKVATNLIRLYEIGPGNTRTPIPVQETRTVVTTPAHEGWYSKPTLQGGWGGFVALTGTTATGKGAGVVATPWLKYGTTRATEDTRWAFLTPSLAITNSEVSVGVLPVSFNFGTLRRQPFTNVWLSPYLGTTNGTSLNRIGGVISVTF